MSWSTSTVYWTRSRLSRSAVGGDGRGALVKHRSPIPPPQCGSTIDILAEWSKSCYDGHVARPATQRFQAQIKRIESNKDGLIHTRPDTDRQRTNAYGRIPITVKWATTCQAVRLGKVCGAAIPKGKRAFYEPISGTVECRDCWT